MKILLTLPLLSLLAVASVDAKEPQRPTSKANPNAEGQTNSPVHEPKKGTPERTAILDTVRNGLEPMLKEAAKEAPELKGQKIVLTVEWLKANETWAYISASFTPDFAEGSVSAVLKKTGDAWEVKDWSMADDVPDYGALAKKTGAPRSAFPKGE